MAKASLDLLRAKVLNAAAAAQRTPAQAPIALDKLAAHVVATTPPEAPPAQPAAPPVASAIALLIAGTALLGLLCPGTAYAGPCTNVPALVCENWIDTWLEIIGLGAIALVAFFVGIAILVGLCRFFRPSRMVRKIDMAVILALAAISALAWAAPADAQSVAQGGNRAVPMPRPFTPTPGLTGNPVKDIKNAITGQQQEETTAANSVESFLAKPFQDLADFIASDSEAAISLSTVVPELQDGHGQQCWIATRQFGEVIKAHPVPLTLKAQTDLEAFRLLTMAANNLCANPHCTQVFADLGNAVQTMAPINYSIPVPSLHDLCAKVPQVAVVPPVTVPAPTPVAAPAAPVTPATPN